VIRDRTVVREEARPPRGGGELGRAGMAEEAGREDQKGIGSGEKRTGERAMR